MTVSMPWTWKSYSHIAHIERDALKGFLFPRQWDRYSSIDSWGDVPSLTTLAFASVCLNRFFLLGRSPMFSTIHISSDYPHLSVVSCLMVSYWEALGSQRRRRSTYTVVWPSDCSTFLTQLPTFSTCSKHTFTCTSVLYISKRTTLPRSFFGWSTSTGSFWRSAFHTCSWHSIL